MKTILLIILALAGISFAEAQKVVRLHGTIIDAKTRETLIGATVMVKGGSQGTTTDLDGRYSLSLPAGTYDLQIKYISYDEQTISGLLLGTGDEKLLDIAMEEAAFALQGVTVTATRKHNSDVSVIQSIKTANMVASGISSQQIGRTQDRDASEVIKRIAGVSVVDDRFVVVRGLHQRYNSTWLNQVAVPGSEADSKAFSFDAIPSSMIDQLFVAKSPSAELPGDFAGGFIRVQTKGLPDNDFVQLSYSLGGDVSDFGKPFYSNRQETLDYLALGQLSRKLPADFAKPLSGSREDFVGYGKQLNEHWNPLERKILPDQRLTITFGHRLDKNDWKIGQISSLSYGYSFDFEEINSKAYGAYQLESQASTLKYDYHDRKYEMASKIALLHNWTFQHRDHKLEFRNLLQVAGKNKTILREGDANFSGEKHIQSYAYQYSNRSIYAGQLNGEHALGEQGQGLHWTLGYAFASRDEPDQRQLETLRISTQDTDDPSDDIYQVSLSTEANPQYMGNLFSELKESLLVLNVNYRHTFDGTSWKPILQAGLYGEYKKRSFDLRVFGYSMGDHYDNELSRVGASLNDLFSDEMLEIGQLAFGERRSDENTYQASNINTSGYAQLELPIGSSLRATLGARFEGNDLRLATRVDGQKVEPVRRTYLLLPSLNVCYNFNARNLLRAAYGRSVNRPEFREIAPFRFYDFEQGRDIKGNIDLEQARIDNIDLRYEFYPNQSETFSVGLFYKDFSKPIEISYSQTSNQYSFQNADRARSYGVEVDIRKTLTEIHALRNITLVANMSLLSSRVYFPEGVEERSRPMQGQSPYLVNVALFYKSDENGWSASALYHISGPRIAAVGTDDRNAPFIQRQPDMYEQARHAIDLSLGKRWGQHWEVKAGVKDVLNQKVVYSQKIKDEAGSLVQENVNKVYRPGRKFNISITYSF